MKLGMLTACLPQWPLEKIAAWAESAGYECLEIGVWPSVGGRDFEASHLPVATYDAAQADTTRAMMASHNLEISALAYYENNLHPDLDRRAEIREHLRKAIDTAQLLEVPYVGTFIGRDPNLSVANNMREAERIFPELVEYGAERGIKLIIENCVMEGWHPDGYPGNIAYSPELWEWMFSLDLYLNWDPSHLTWIGIDPVETIAPYADRIVHAQAKDVELNLRDRNRYGVFGTVDKEGDPWRTGWWRYRVPGRGHVDWPAVVDRLYESGFTGTLSVEHEDPLWSGTPERITEGLRIAQTTLRPLIGPDNVSPQLI